MTFERAVTAFCCDGGVADRMAWRTQRLRLAAKRRNALEVGSD